MTVPVFTHPEFYGHEEVAFCHDPDSGLKAITFEYTGADCSASNNPQEGKATCSGDPAGAEVSVEFTGKDPGKRKEFFYITDDGDLSAIRYEKWKIVFLQQKATGIDVWREPFVPVRFPYLVDLRADPYERAMRPGPSGRSASYEYDKWHAERMFTMVPAQAITAKFLGTFEDYPPRQKPGSFSVGDALATLQTAAQGAGK